jgi:broad specificity phosphatase PhoE
MDLILVRHGETEWNVTLQYQGHANVPLNERGRLQARLLGERLAKKGAVALYASDIVRAWETAGIIGPYVDLMPQKMTDLREIDVGQWEGLTPEELYRRFPDHMQEYERDPARTVRMGGESYAQLQQRSLKALHTIENSHGLTDTVIAVSHGGTIRALLCHVIDLDLGNFGRLWLDNGSITMLRRDTKGWRLTCLNDTAHLEDLTFEGGE